MYPAEASTIASQRSARWAGLMAAAQNGDKASYERLLREVVPFIRSIVSGQQRVVDRIDDVVQDVLLTIHRVRHTYDPDRPFEHWLATIAKRRSIDSLRRRLRTQANETADDEAYETFADPQANRSTEVRDAAEVLGGAISGLTDRQKEAIELLKLKEMSLAEASKVSGQSVAALKVNVHRAIKALRTKLKGD
jgi:RNA polymerase sigma-70 factor (ECF subfamily)